MTLDVLKGRISNGLNIYTIRFVSLLEIVGIVDYRYNIGSYILYITGDQVLETQG